jgi:hypothetical protein
MNDQTGNRDKSWLSRAEAVQVSEKSATDLLTVDAIKTAKKSHCMSKSSMINLPHIKYIGPMWQSIAGLFTGFL